MGLSIGPVIGVKGANVFRMEFREMVAVAKQLDSEMNRLTSSFNKNDTALKKNAEIRAQLNKQIEQQENVVEKAKHMVELSKQAEERAVNVYENKKQILKDLREEQAASNETLQRGKETAEHFRQVHEKTVETLGEESEEAKKTKQDWKDATKAYEDAEKRVEGLNKEIERQEDAVRAAEAEVHRNRETTAKWNDVVATAETTVNELNKELKETPGNLGSIGEMMTGVGESIYSFGQTLTKYISAPLTALGTYGVKEAATFTDAIAKISTIADESKVPLQTFREEITRISDETGRSIQDVSAATYQALSAAVKTEDAIEFVEGAANLARAGFLDLYGAVDVTTTILNAYGKSVDEVEHISDVLVKTQDMGKTTVDQLAASMGNVIPTAAQYGIKLEDLGAAYVVLTRQGINTARSTTYLRSAFTELEKESSDASKTLRNYTGKSFMQLMQDGKSLGEVMQILRDAVNGDEEAFIHLFGSVRTAAGALALANTSAEEYASILKEVSYSSGQTARNVRKLETPALKAQKALNRLKNTAMDIGTVLMEEFMPYFEAMVNAVKDVTTWFKKLSVPTKKSIINLGLVAAATGPVIMGFGKMVVGLGKTAIMLDKLSKVSAPAAKAIGKVAENVILFAAENFGLIVGLGLLAAGMTAVAVSVNEVNEKQRELAKTQYGLSEEGQILIDDIHMIRDAYVSYREAASESITSIQIETGAIQGMVDEYHKLLDANGNVIKGKEEHAAFIKENLAEALGIEVSDLDELIQKHGDLDLAIEASIQEMEKEARMQAYQQLYTQAMQTRVQAEIDLKAAEAERTEQLHKIAEAQDAERTAWENYQRALKNGEPDVQAAYNAWSDANYALGVAKGEYKEIEGAISEANKTIRETSADIETINGILDGTIDDTKNNIVDGSNEAAQAAQDDAEKTREKVATEMGETKTAVQTEVGEIVNIVADADTPDAGEKMLSGIGVGLTNPYTLGIVIGKAKHSVRKIIQAMNEEADSHSPSRVTEQLGEYMGMGLAQGLENTYGLVAEAGRGLAEAAINGSDMTGSYPLGSASGASTYNKSISAPISVSVNVNGNVDNPQALVDEIEDMLVQRIIRNERVFA